jgi:hypothetical protein
MMEFNSSLIVGAVMIGVMSLPITSASAMPQLDPSVAQADTLIHIETAWWHHHHWHHWRHWHHWH